MEENKLNELFETVKRISYVINEEKGTDTVIFDLRKRYLPFQWSVISTVNSEGHLKGVINRLLSVLGEENIMCDLSKRLISKNWLSIDCSYFCINLMREESRDYYDLEDFYYNCPNLRID